MIPKGKVLDAENIVQIEANRSPFPGIEFEGFPSRDARKYSSLYKIPDVHTFIRGTYRHKVRPWLFQLCTQYIVKELFIMQGTCKIVNAFSKLGLLNSDEQQRLKQDAPSIQWVRVFPLCIFKIVTTCREI